MSLFDALLLDPNGFDVWLAVRADGLSNAGTIDDPYNCSTQAQFDAVMQGLGTLPNTSIRIHFGAGIPS